MVIWGENCDMYCLPFSFCLQLAQAPSLGYCLLFLFLFRHWFLRHQWRPNNQKRSKSQAKSTRSTSQSAMRRLGSRQLGRRKSTILVPDASDEESI